MGSVSLRPATPQRGCSLISFFISSNEGHDSPELNSTCIQTYFEDSPSDAILLHDACFSADTRMTRRVENTSYRHGVTELIAASGFGETTPGMDTLRFSRSFWRIVSSQNSSSSPPGILIFFRNTSVC